MREGLHPLLYSRVAPGLYCVYLHPEDFSRVEGLIPRVRSEAQRALAEEMRRLNAPSKPHALRWFVADEQAPPVEEPAGGWVIQIEADRDDEVAPGTFVILSKLSLPPLPQFEGGAPTTKVFKTVISGESRTKTEQVFAAPPAAPVASAPALAGPGPGAAATAIGATGVGATGVGGPPVAAPTAAAPTVVGASPVIVGPPAVRAPQPVIRGLAEIAVQDAHGHRIFVMDKQDIKVGRGGQFRLVDLQLDGSTRISRVHARIRRDEQGRFFIKDLSEWGTTVNGQRIARGVIREGEEVREIDVESELPTRARIVLAEAVVLEFTAAPAPATATAPASAGATTTTAMRTERVRDLATPATPQADDVADLGDVQDADGAAAMASDAHGVVVASEQVHVGESIAPAVPAGALAMTSDAPDVSDPAPAVSVPAATVSPAEVGEAALGAATAGRTMGAGAGGARG